MKVLQFGRPGLTREPELFGNAIHLRDNHIVVGLTAPAPGIRQSLIRRTPRFRKPAFSRGIEENEGRILIPSTKQFANHRLGGFAFVGFNADANKFARGVNKVLGREQTVLRGCVARSEYARDSRALCGRGHKENRTIRTFRLLKPRFPSRVPSDAG